MKPTAQSDGEHRPGRRVSGRAQQNPITDPYQPSVKPREPTACRQCLAVYHLGRWQWMPKSAGAREDLCPACRRINDRMPAGIVTLHGPLSSERAMEMSALARHQEDAEREQHPVNRIIAIEQGEGSVVITTTDIHLPRRIAEAVKRAYHGQLDIDFDEDAYFVRADWHPPR
jgi:hypothetical protein